MRLKKTATTVLAMLIALFTTFGVAACGPADDGIDEDKTQLYIVTRNSGFGSDWYVAIGKAFEEKYANVSFEEGKVGVEVIFTPDANISSAATLLPNSSYDVVITDNVYPSTLRTSGSLMDITDVVTSDASAFTKTDVNGNPVTLGEDKTLESKLFDRQKEFFGKAGKYYVLPWSMSYASLTYNATLFEEKGYYFAEDKENASYPLVGMNSSYTGEPYTGRGLVNAEATEKSVGPDGIKGTYDDGMPSSYEEFMYLMDWMTKTNVAPLIVTGVNNDEYAAKYYNLLMMGYGGKSMQALFDADSKGQTVSVQKSWNGLEPVFEDTVITEENGYLMFQTEAKYNALDLMIKTTVDGTYMSERNRPSSHLDAHDIYVRSRFNNDKDIAMIIEGSYWYYEATATRKTALAEFRKADDFKTLSVPRKLTGTVEEGEGTVQTLVAESNVDAFINNNTLTQKKKDLAKLFLRFCYTDEMMSLYTKMCQIPVNVKYEVSSETYAELDAYGKSQMDMYKAAIDNDAIVFPYSTARTYENAPLNFELTHHQPIWKNKQGEQAWRYFYKLRDNGQNPLEKVKNFFEDSKVDATTWQNSYVRG